MRYRVELSSEAQRYLARLPLNLRERLNQAIDEVEQKDDSLWSNIKALHGSEWKGRLRKRVGPYRIIFRKYPERATVEISAI